MVSNCWGHISFSLSLGSQFVGVLYCMLVCWSNISCYVIFFLGFCLQQNILSSQPFRNIISVSIHSHIFFFLVLLLIYDTVSLFLPCIGCLMPLLVLLVLRIAHWRCHWYWHRLDISHLLSLLKWWRHVFQLPQFLFLFCFIYLCRLVSHAWPNYVMRDSYALVL